MNIKWTPANIILLTKSQNTVQRITSSMNDCVGSHTCMYVYICHLQRQLAKTQFFTNLTFGSVYKWMILSIMQAMLILEKRTVTPNSWVIRSDEPVSCIADAQHLQSTRLKTVNLILYKQLLVAYNNVYVCKKHFSEIVIRPLLWLVWHLSISDWTQ